MQAARRGARRAAAAGVQRRGVVTRAAQDSRPRRQAPERAFLYPVGRRACAFDIDGDPRTGPMRESTGLEHGDRVRAYAGRYVGRLASVIGMRGGAVWVHFSGQQSPEGVPIDQLPRHDLRLVGKVELEGLPADAYKDGDELPSALWTTAELHLEAKSPELLDEASTQHLVSELPTAQRCERCAADLDWRRVREAVQRAAERLQLPHFTALRLERLMRLATPALPALSSPSAVADAIARRRRVAADGAELPQDALAAELEARNNQWGRRVALQFMSQNVTFPVCALSDPNASVKSAVTVRDDPWIGEGMAASIGLRRADFDTWKGKHGTVEIVYEPVPIDDQSGDTARVAAAVLSELELYPGRHREYDPPPAEVWCVRKAAPAAQQPSYRCLCRACVVEELAALPPDQRANYALFTATGYPSFTFNAWHQPWNMTNELGLDRFAPHTQPQYYYSDASEFEVHSTP
eukprot:TRINITY_DN60560_c0_g1_i1.p1 TRINITY_DN60560_c0_g1~~TRINITY_DN60560_c0_g1_i1.p1  ORF type:complete len:489 (+),score=161.45 TRINITY_DN60560_c0_g1_i1:75-1469(+)